MPALCSKLAYYAGIMLDALACLLCLKLCRHNMLRPSGVLLEVQRQLGLEREKVLELVQEKETLQQQLSTSELQSLKEEVKRGQDKVVQLWHTNCQQLLTHDSEMLEKDREIRVLCDRLHKAEIELATLKLERLSAGTHPRVSHSTTTNLMGPTAEGAIPTGTFTATAAPWGRDHSQYRRGKAPPIDEFTGEDRRITFDDWLPILERAATWNGWTQDELLMQLTGYLRGRALQEWKLLDSKDKTTYHSTVKTLREQLDPGNQSLAALDFRHASQRSSETVSDFLRRLEHNYQIAFGRENLSAETRDMLLYGQLQEGLPYSLIESPSVSGAQSYRELCIAAKKEERRLAELKKKQQYLKTEKPPSGGSTRGSFQRNYTSNHNSGGSGNKFKPPGKHNSLRCYLCDSPHHLARDCHKRPTESEGKSSQKGTQESKGARMIRTRYYTSNQKLQSHVEVKIEGVPVTGIIDTGSDITIIRGDLFYHIVGTAGLEESSLKPADLKACTYDQKPINLDGQLDLHISFGERVICTTVYVKLVAPDQLLLSEAVCCKLGIVSYHPSVQSVQGYHTTVTSRPTTSTTTNDCKSDTLSVSDKENKEIPKAIPTLQSGTEEILQPVADTTELTLQSETIEKMEQPVAGAGNNEENLTEKSSPSNANQVTKDGTSSQGETPQISENVVSQVRLIKAVRLPANHSATVPVQLTNVKGIVLLEPSQSLDQSLKVEECLLEVKEDGSTALVIVNNSNSSCQLKKGMEFGQAIGAAIVDHTQQESLLTPQLPATAVSLTTESEMMQQSLNVYSVAVPTTTSSERVKWRQQQLSQLLRDTKGRLSSEGDHLPLEELLSEYHDVFSLDEDERGETDMIEFEINTGDELPRKQAARRIPYGAHQEVAEQLERMQKIGVIKPSKSPWSSPVVLVRKRDGTLRFCVDYRVLNSVTKPDVFPLPRINDLLDQLGKSKYYTTLDLVSGYWQIRVHANSQEKTAFATHQGLYEFRVMPFGVMNAPAVFQRLMQRVLSGLQFISVYLDDVIVYSETLAEHVSHLRIVFEHLRTAGLKLNPAKCRFVCDEVEYLGHLITPAGLKPSERDLTAVREFPVPTNLKHLRQFFGTDISL